MYKILYYYIQLTKRISILYVTKCQYCIPKQQYHNYKDEGEILMKLQLAIDLLDQKEAAKLAQEVGIH